MTDRAMALDRNVPRALDAAHLLADVRALSEEIGARPPTSVAERQAAAYITEQLRPLVENWHTRSQPFRSISGMRYRIAPLAVAVGASLLLGRRGARWAQWLGGGLSIALSVASRDAFLARPAAWEAFLPRGTSQNVIVRIPPRGRRTRRVVFLAHMDSGQHRMTANARFVSHLPQTLGALTLLALVGGVLTVLAGKSAQRWRTLRTLIAGAAFGSAALAVLDEMGEPVDGAIGNASGVAALLGLARALHERSLTSTEVILAFTGSATAVSTGAEALARAYREQWSDALWVVVSNVGAGELCWVTQHGISPYATYMPDPLAVRVMERVADARPDLGLMGKRMVTLDELARLRDYGLHAVALMGYDRVSGLIPHWRQRSDTFAAVQAPTIERAAHTCWTVAQVMDQAERWPLPPA